MAKKKKEQELQYLQMPLPQGQKRGKMTKVSWSGINYRQTKDTGEISKELNISTDVAPYLTPSEKRKKIMNLKMNEEGAFLDIYGYGDGLVYSETYPCEGISTTGMEYDAKIDYRLLTFSEEGTKEHDYWGYAGVIAEGVLNGDGSLGAKTVLFRYFTSYKNIAEIEMGERLLFFPAKRSVNFKPITVVNKHFHNSGSGIKGSLITMYLRQHGSYSGWMYFPCIAEYFKYKDSAEEEKPDCAKTAPGSYNGPWIKYRGKGDGSREWHWNSYSEWQIPEAAEITVAPSLKHLCVAHQRLFGIDDGRVFASGFNDYENWNFDTADTFSAENAWMSATQSARGGNNTGIKEYGGSVFVFKEKSTLEITNTKNPFRINEVFSTGAIDQRGIQVVGNYLIFVSDESVMLYNGSSLKDIGYNLGVERFYSAVSGTDGRKFYLFCETDKKEKNLFVYDTYTGFWTEEDIRNEAGEEMEIVSFAICDKGVFLVDADFNLYKLDTKDYDHEWMMETDFILNNTVDIKHINKVQLFAELSPGTKVRAYILYDGEEFSEETSHLIIERENRGEKTINVPIRVVPRKTANYGFKIRIEGYGFVKLYQMELLITGGGEKYISE